MPQLEDAGLWMDRLPEADFAGRPALFLDRDGVLVEEVDFLRRPEDVRLTPGAAAAIARVNAEALPVIVVTNQSGIARGYYGWADFEAVQSRIAKDLASDGAHLDLVLACGYHRDGIGVLARDHHWRKPETGMLLEARDRLGVDLARSYLVGDRLTDLEAARAAGLKAGALVPTGYGASEAERHRAALTEWRKDFDLAVGKPVDAAIDGWLASLTRTR